MVGMRSHGTEMMLVFDGIGWEDTVVTVAEPEVRVTAGSPAGRRTTS
jgi:hypothetical protein